MFIEIINLYLFKKVIMIHITKLYIQNFNQNKILVHFHQL